MKQHVFTGFGFGPIQSALFVSEAFSSGNFSRIVVAEIDQSLVDALRANNGSYYVNVAHQDGIKTKKIENTELLNPQNDTDRATLIEALAQSTEIVTSLPSVSFYNLGGPTSIASLIAGALKNNPTNSTIIYTSENNNHAAEILQKDLTAIMGPLPENRVNLLNTVIGKMSRVVTDPAEIDQLNLTPIAPGIDRAFLVEQFNRILVTRCKLPNFQPGINVFIEKDDLMPFEEAKLFGHNAIHALLAYLGAALGCQTMHQLKDNTKIMDIARHAFLVESGQSLTKKYSSLGDTLFTEMGYREYAEDLLERITNPYLLDTMARAGRDVSRKMSAHDRIIGTMDLALDQGITPTNMALGAIAGIAALFNPIWDNKIPDNFSPDTKWQDLTDQQIKDILQWLWTDNSPKHAPEIIKLTQQAKPKLVKLLHGPN